MVTTIYLWKYQKLLVAICLGLRRFKKTLNKTFYYHISVVYGKIHLRQQCATEHNLE